jgi:hypothetical protein
MVPTRAALPAACGTAVAGKHHIDDRQLLDAIARKQSCGKGDWTTPIVPHKRKLADAKRVH